MTDLINKLQERLNTKITNFSTPPKGMGSFVVFITDIHGNEYAVKVSEEANNDAVVLKILKDNQVNIAVPELIDTFSFEGKSVVIQEKISEGLLESVAPEDMIKYVPSMIKNLKELQKVKSSFAGFLNSDTKFISWKEFLLSRFNGSDSSLDWNEIANRKVLNKELLNQSITKLINSIESTNLISSNYSLLHSDFNQRNLFVDEDTKEITAVIDWGEAIYGDPIYEYGEIYMLLWHYEQSDSVLHQFWNSANFSEYDKMIAYLYFVYRVILYLADYSEEENDFNLGRIKMHEQFLNEFDWSVF